MLKIQTATITDFQQNCRLLVDDATNKSVLVDPGGESDYLLSLVAESGTELQSLVLTHSHIDHCGGVAGFLREFDGELPLLGHETEADMRAGIAQQAMMFNMSTADYENCPEPTEYIDDGYVLKIGECEATALFTPGHAPGHLAFFFENIDWNLDGREGSGPLLIAGDALFNGSIGRTDLPRGNHAQLIESIKTRLMTLPDETVVLCGHGPETMIGNERKTNPYLR
jgi:glyoxylase-like metal-dependent hydrolase (beta-lactamase superfamily II)